MRSGRLFMAVVAIALVGGASASQASTTSRAAGSTLRLAYLEGFPKSFLPVGQQSGAEQIVFNMVYDTLVKVKADDQTVVPDLASSWTVTGNHRVYTFHLHPGVKWQDGQPFTSADVVFTVTWACQHPEYFTGYQPTYWFAVRGCSKIKDTSQPLPGISAPNKNTVVISLNSPNYWWLAGVVDPVYSILPAHLLKSIPPAQMAQSTYDTSAPIGTGPYKFTKLASGQYVELTANPNYFLGAPHIQTIYDEFLTSDQAVAELQTGALDLAMDIDPTAKPTIDGLKSVKESLAPGVGVQGFKMRLDNPTIANPLVRQALLYAINRSAIIKTVFKGLGTPINLFPGYSQTASGINRYPYDPAKAKQLLAQAKFNFNAPFRFIYDTAEPGWPEEAQAIQAYLTAVGIKSTLEPLDDAAWTARVSEKQSPEDWELSLGCCGAYRNPDNASAFFHCTKGPTFAFGYVNCGLDARFNLARATLNTTKRNALYAQIGLILNHDLPYVPLFQITNLMAATTRLSGVAYHTNDRATFMDVADWTMSGK